MLIKYITNLIFPDYCVKCKRGGSILCKVCIKEIRYNLPECYKCRRLSQDSLTHYTCSDQYGLYRVKILWVYNKTTKLLISQYKYKGVKKIGDFLYENADQILSRYFEKQDIQNTLLISVPSHKYRTNKRGFNQVESITRLFSKKYKIQSPTLVERIKNTSKQSGLEKDERFKNISSSFYIKKENKKILQQYKKVIIVDDILTTGATLGEFTKTISQANPECIIEAIILFRGKPPRRSKNHREG